MEQIDALACLLRIAANTLRRLSIEQDLADTSDELQTVSQDIDDAARRIDTILGRKRAAALDRPPERLQS